MKSIFVLSLGLLAAFGLASTGLTNAPPLTIPEDLENLPKASPPNKEIEGVPFVLRVDRGSSGNRLIIPKKHLAAVLKADQPVPAPAPSEGASNLGSQGTRSVVAALFLSFSAASIFLIRKNKSARTMATAVIVVIACVGAIQYANADLGPPRPRREIDPFNPPGFKRPPKVQQRETSKTPKVRTYGNQTVVIEIAEHGDVVELIRGTKRSSKSRE